MRAWVIGLSILSLVLGLASLGLTFWACLLHLRAKDTQKNLSTVIDSAFTNLDRIRASCIEIAKSGADESSKGEAKSAGSVAEAIQTDLVAFSQNHFKQQPRLAHTDRKS